MDLLCLVADKDIEAAIDGLLVHRPESLEIRSVEFETVVHPQRDPGCFHNATRLLSDYRRLAEHALVLFDSAWEGAPAATGGELEDALERSLRRSSLSPWARAVVVDPEVEAWVFADSIHVAESLGWEHGMEELRRALEGEGLWRPEQAKPVDPKAAVEWALRRAGLPRSSSIYRELARRVSFVHCQDRSFLRLRTLLRDWFGSAQGSSLDRSH